MKLCGLLESIRLTESGALVGYWCEQSRQKPARKGFHMDEKFDINDYLAKRVDDQIDWYSDKSGKAQRSYKLTQIAELIMAALIPLFSGLIGRAWWLAIPVGLFGAAIAVLEGVSKIYKFHEKWIEYRSTSELLKYEKTYF